MRNRRLARVGVSPVAPVGAAPAAELPSPGGSSPYLTPGTLAYLMGPIALATLLFLRRIGVVADDPALVYVGVFLLVPITSALAEIAYRREQSRARLHARVAAHIAAVTTVTYLTGWGPVLTGAYAIVAMENVARSGSKTWRVTASWSVIGIGAGQIAIWLHWAPSYLPVVQAEALGLLGLIVVIFVSRMAGATSDQKEKAELSMRTSEDRFRSLVQNSSDTTLVLGAHGVVTYASPAISSLIGKSPEDIVGRRATDLVHPDDRERVELESATRLGARVVTEPIQFRMACADGTWRYTEAVLTDLRDRPSVGGYVANVRDISERKEAESLLAHQALHDPLTGLANRVLLVDRLRQAVSRRVREGSVPPVVMFLDLDRFKLVNDSLGHSTGDALLVEVADRLRSVARESDTLARFGGDEFVMLCEGIADQRAVTALAERTMRSLDAPFVLNGEKVNIGVSIGVAFLDDAVPSAEELLGDADFAMYLAKARSGSGRIQMFDRATRASARRRVHTETALAGALDRQELVVFYQPIVDAQTRRWVGVEALLRWMHPTRGLLRPGAFLDIAEQSGLIVPIGAWVLAEACTQVGRWNASRPPADQLGLSVNLSGRQLADPNLASSVARTLELAGVDPHSMKLLLEVTETLLPTDQDEARRNLAEIHRLGIELGIDDFGTGYSSLTYVRELPVSIVKIDRSFVECLGRSPQDEAIVTAVVQLAHTLRLKVIAEGVETEEQLEYLVGVSCDYAQGYLFGRPQPANLVRVPEAVADRPSLSTTTTG